MQYNIWIDLHKDRAQIGGEVSLISPYKSVRWLLKQVCFFFFTWEQNPDVRADQVPYSTDVVC